MTDVNWNVRCWEDSYNWSGEGEEWSESWGNSEAQWFGCIYPRIHKFIPCNNILEIAPGYGRWTRFLINCSVKSFWGVDISEQCIEACKNRFKDATTAHFFCNDGKSLSAVKEKQIDFIFSFDSLVHADISVFESYIPQIMNILSPKGVCFLHHSNLKFLIKNGNFSTKTPLEKRHFRDDSMSGQELKTIVESCGGRVLIQENINWGCPDLIDCFTLFSHNNSFNDIQYRQINNDKFMKEASLIKENISAYCF